MWASGRNCNVLVSWLKTRSSTPSAVQMLWMRAIKKLQEVLGEAFGLTVRSRHVGAQIGAAFKAIGGGELRGLTAQVGLEAVELADVPGGPVRAEEDPVGEHPDAGLPDGQYQEMIDTLTEYL